MLGCGLPDSEGWGEVGGAGGSLGAGHHSSGHNNMLGARCGCTVQAAAGLQAAGDLGQLSQC